MSSVLIKYSSPIEKRLEFYNDFWGERACIGSGSFQWTLSGSIHCAETWQEWCFFSNNEEFIRFLTWVWRGYWYEMSGTLRGTVQKMRAIKVFVNSSLLVRWASVCTIFFIFSVCPPLILRIREDPSFLLHSCNAFGPRSHNVLSTYFWLCIALRQEWGLSPCQ